MARNLERLRPISTALLKAAPVQADLYLPGNAERAPKLYRSQAVPLDLDAIERLESRGVRELLVSDEAREEYLSRLMQLRHGDDAETLAVRFRALFEARKSGFESAYHGAETAPVIDFANQLSGELCWTLRGGAYAAGKLLQLMDHDQTTYTHCVNVATYCLLLAWAMGIHDEGSLQQIAIGGMLHDIGKRGVDRSLLVKAGVLSAAERCKMQDHARLGFLELIGHYDLAAALMAYQHHERMDGSGYPVGVLRDDIHLWARICSVADVYHALTSSRPYRTPLSSADACAHLATLAGDGLDAEPVDRWIRLARDAALESFAAVAVQQAV